MHTFLLLFSAWWILFGIFLCAMLFFASLKSGKGLWLVAIPGILVIAILTIDFVCHMLHLPYSVIPHQTQVVSAIRWTLRIAAVPLVVMRLYEIWSKKRAQAVSPHPPLT